MLPKRGKDPQVNSEDFSGLKTSFPLMLFQSPSADKLKLISRFIFQTNSVSMMASSCISFEQTDLAAESRDRNHNNTLSSDCCPITPQHECQFATYECGVNDPRVCVVGVGCLGLVICKSLEKCRFRSPKVIGFHYKSYNDQTSLPEFSVWMFAGVSASLLTLCTVGQDGYTQGFWRRCQMDQGAQMGLHLVQTLCTGIRKKEFKTLYAINKTSF